MEQAKLYAGLTALILMLSGCAATPSAVPVDVIPQPTINPILLEACADNFTMLAPGATFQDVLHAKQKDVMLFDACRCRHEELRKIVCKITNTECAASLNKCKSSF